MPGDVCVCCFRLSFLLVLLFLFLLFNVSHVILFLLV